MKYTKRNYIKSKQINKRKKTLRRRRHKQRGGSKCARMSEETNYNSMGKLVCAYANKEKDLYRQVVLNLINKNPSDFIKYVYSNYTTFSPHTRQALGQAFVTFQEDAIKTYNLEHILPGTVDDNELMAKDW